MGDSAVKILAIEQELPDVTAGQFDPYLEAEAARVWELYQSGLIRELYFDRDAHRAVLMLECPDEIEAQHALQTLPLVQAGLINFEVIPLIPYSGFGRLFAQKWGGREE